MTTEQLPENPPKHTYKDFKNLPEDGHRYELHDGEIYMMSSPTGKHQDIQREVLKQFIIVKQAERSER